MNSYPKQQVLRQRYIPQRSCIACRQTKAKKDLVRLICNAGIVEIDTEGKKTGRGAYLCPIRGCWEKGLKSNRLEYTLRTKLTLENRQMLVEHSNNLPEREENHK